MRFGTITNATAPYSVTDDLDSTTAMPVDVWMPAGPPTLNDRVLYDVADGQVVVLADVTGSQQGIPGEVRMYGGATAPAGWLLCDGSSVLRATYPRLFAAIGTAFGNVDGTHFNLPDMGGRFPTGNAPVGQQGGANTHTHPLSDNGQAQIVLGASSPGLWQRRVNAAGWTANFQSSVNLAAANSSSAFSIGAALTGNTDSAALVPLYTRLLFIIRT
jgi:microcystin-dependent protein